MKKVLTILLLMISINKSTAQLSIASGDSISVLPGTLFTLQENLINNGKIYNDGILILNGTSLQTIDGTGNINNLTADNNAALLNDLLVNNNLLINAGKTVDLGNYTLSNNGSVNGAGLIKGSANATINLTGAGTSSINFDQSNTTVSNALKYIAISNGNVVLQNKLYVYNGVLPNSGSITLNDELVLRSNSSKTASVGITGSSIIYGSNGKFVIERFIPGRRAWRLLTAPVTPASSVKISDAWQDSKPRVTDVNSISNPEPGFGTHVTFGLPATNGYDQGINGNTSIRYLNSTGWNGVPTATNDGSTLNSGIITDQPGYMLFVRGDRGTQLSQATGAVTTPAVLRPNGKINTGNIDMPLSVAFNNAGSSFRVVGNPYPSSVNFHSIVSNAANTTNGFGDAFYLWDPNITGSNGVGGFVGLTYNAATSIIAGKPVYDRSVPSSISNNGDIQSGAAFIIDYAGASSTLRIEENNKSIESNNTFFRPVRQLQTTLLAENTDGSTSVNDGTLISFDEINSNEIDNADMKKLGNFAENISVFKKSTPLCIEKRKPATAGDTIFYAITKLRQKKYQLQFLINEAGLPAGIAPVLEDNFLNTQTALQLNDTSVYGFAVSADTATAAANRFMIVFKQINSFVRLTAVFSNGDVQLQWSVKDTAGILYYQMQRSEDSIQFSTWLTTGAADSNATDPQLLPGIYFYRVKCVNNKGVVSYSSIKKIVVPENGNNIFVFPNPVTRQRFTLVKKQAFAGVYELRLLNREGKLLSLKSFQHNGGWLQQAVSVPVAMRDGIYFLELNMPGKKQETLKIIFHQQ